jgi:hypothetical protein
MTVRKTIAEQPNGDKGTLDGTEKFPISGSYYALISEIASYIRTLTETLTNKTLTSPTLTSPTITGTTNAAVYDGDVVTSGGDIVWT